MSYWVFQQQQKQIIINHGQKPSQIKKINRKTQLSIKQLVNEHNIVIVK